MKRKRFLIYYKGGLITTEDKIPEDTNGVAFIREGHLRIEDFEFTGNRWLFVSCDLYAEIYNDDLIHTMLSQSLGVDIIIKFWFEESENVTIEISPNHTHLHNHQSITKLLDLLLDPKAMIAEGVIRVSDFVYIYMYDENTANHYWVKFINF